MLEAVLIGLVVLVGLELVLRLIYPAPRLRKEPQVQILLDARMGYRTKPDQKAYEMDAPVTINKLGFRGPDFDPAREPGSLRVLGLGNSITFGSGLADHETYLARLEGRLREERPDRQVEVLNAAMEGFTIRQYLPFLERVLPKVKPDVVILGAAFRDLHFHPRMGQLEGKVDEEAWKAVKKKFDQTNVKVVHIDRAPFRERLVRRTKNAIRRWRTAYVAYYLGEKLKNRIAPPGFIQWQISFLSGEETEPILARRVETKKTLATMRDLCVEHGAKLALLAFPIYDQILRDYPNSTWPQILAEACEHHDLAYLDLLGAIREEYRKAGRSIFLPYDGNHYSASCHDSISVAVLDFLKSARLVPEADAPRAEVTR